MTQDTTAKSTTSKSLTKVESKQKWKIWLEDMVRIETIKAKAQNGITKKK